MCFIPALSPAIRVNAAGEIALQVTPYEANSRATDQEKVTIAPLAVL